MAVEAGQRDVRSSTTAGAEAPPRRPPDPLASAARIAFIYDGLKAVAQIVETGRRRFEVWLPVGRRIGVFATREAARAAVRGAVSAP